MRFAKYLVWWMMLSGVQSFAAEAPLSPPPSSSSSVSATPPVAANRFPRVNLNNQPKQPRQIPFQHVKQNPPSYLTKPVPHTIRSTYQSVVNSG